MSIFKRICSLFLTVVFLFTTLFSAGMIVYASMQSDESSISPASLLPLEEVDAYLVVGDHDDVDISAVPIDMVLSNLMDSDGNHIEIDENAKIAWCYCIDQDGSTITDDYYILEEGGTVDLSVYDDYERYTLEMIVGDGNQLNPDNIRYRVTVYLADEFSGLRSYELYTQDADGTRHQVIPADQQVESLSSSSLGLGNINASYRVFIVPDYEEGTEVYLGIDDQIDEHPYIRCDPVNFVDYLTFLSDYQSQYGTDFSHFSYEDLADQYSLADQLVNVDMTQTDAGYKSTWDIPEYAGGSLGPAELSNMFAFIYRDYSTGQILSLSFVSFYITNSLSTFDDDAFEAIGGTSVKMTSTLHAEVDTDGFQSPSDLTEEDIYEVRRVILKEGYSADANYRYALYAHNPLWENANDHVTKAVIGSYDSLDEVEEVEDIEDISDYLLPKSNNTTGVIGYEANYSTGVPVSIFFEDGSVYHYLIVFQDYSTEYDLDYLREYTELPIIGEADPWLRVTGASDANGNEYDTYYVENGKTMNMDTYYGYGYQTIFIHDANADLSSIAPTFWCVDPTANRVYALLGDGASDTRVEEGYTGDFEKENQQFTGVIIGEDGTENQRNYWITFKKLNNSGPELYVYGPSEREVILDEYFEFKHDILIANIGNAPLEDISVELRDAENVKLDPYWTVGGEGNDTLAAFSTTSSDTEYGELPNLAKIRLLPDGDGEVKGTLIIRAKDQEPVMITLNGTAQNPEIVTDTLEDAVKYVPYQHIIATNNMREEIDTKFTVTEGQLPEGITLNEDTGEIYGVPTVPEGNAAATYTFTVEASFTWEGYEDYFAPSYAEYSLVVNPNTDENVFLASDSTEGYEIEQYIGTQVGDYTFELDEIADEVFTSAGEYDEFVALYLNGEQLEEGVDYDSESGSTRITIRSQTFENKAARGRANTIAMEFRKDTDGDGRGDQGSEMNRTSQNFTIRSTNEESSEDNADQIAANRVISLIRSIPAPITLDSEDAISAAREAYDALTSAQQQLVTNYRRLTASEATLAQLKQDAESSTDDSQGGQDSEQDSQDDTNAEQSSRDDTNSGQDSQNDTNAEQSSRDDTNSEQNSQAAEAAGVTINGILVDAAGNPCANRTVEIHSTPQTTQTDAEGRFRFTEIPFGTHTILVRGTDNSIAAERSITIQQGSPFSMSGDQIVAENGSSFTMRIQLEADTLSFLEAEENSSAPAEESSSEASSSGTVTSPQTGDTSAFNFWCISFLASLSLLIVTISRRSKRKRDSDE